MNFPTEFSATLSLYFIQVLLYGLTRFLFTRSEETFHLETARFYTKSSSGQLEDFVV